MLLLILLIVVLVALMVIVYRRSSRLYRAENVVGTGVFGILVGAVILLTGCGIATKTMGRDSATYEIASVVSVGTQHEITTTDGDKFIATDAEVRIGPESEIVVYESLNSQWFFDLNGKHVMATIAPEKAVK